ncbi:MAG: hemin uptake protein HemP [Sulfuritalea sp.]|nr:hemin uptake protein HemP [Sulfuritalea sp.]
MICIETKPATRADREPSPGTRAKARAGSVDSAALLGARNEVEIIHQGETYRLRRTRQGKLILTK